MGKKKSTLRKSVQRKNARIRQMMEGVPRLKSSVLGRQKMMKEFSKFLAEQKAKGRLKTHEEAGLPDEVDGLHFSRDYFGNEDRSEEE